ncbi:MAG: NADPH-dependent F420 reductase, partial [Myxococcales bacterium]
MGAWIAVLLAAAGAVPTPTGKPLKIGIIGAGKIGGSLATLWAKAGHEVLISSRHPEELQELANSLGPKARAGTPEEAAAFGDVVLISIPYGALPQVGRDLAKE